MLEFKVGKSAQGVGTKTNIVNFSRKTRFSNKIIF